MTGSKTHNVNKGQIINGSKWYRVAGHSFGFAPEDRFGPKHKILFCLLFYMGVVWEVLWLEFYIEKQEAMDSFACPNTEFNLKKLSKIIFALKFCPMASHLKYYIFVGLGQKTPPSRTDIDTVLVSPDTMTKGGGPHVFIFFDLCLCL